VSTLSKQKFIGSRTQAIASVKSITEKALHGSQFSATLKISEEGKMRPFLRSSGAGNFKNFISTVIYFSGLCFLDLFIHLLRRPDLPPSQ